MPIRKLMLLATFCFTCSTVTAAGQSQTDLQGDALVWTECHIPNVTQKAFCTNIEAPLDWNDKSAGFIGLFVARLPATGTDNDPDPFVILAGGPGQAASDTGMLVSMAFDKVRRSRDILLIDHRGVGRSNPLKCPDIEESLVVTMAGSDRMAKYCHDKQTADTRYFGMDAAQRDFVHVIRELGYSRVNLYGVSYGTRSASWIMRSYPELVRSVVLDGVIAPETKLFETSPTGAQQALDALFASCDADIACQAAFPDLREDFYRYATALTETPQKYAITHPLKGHQTTVTMHHDGFVQSVRAVLYSSQMSASLPFALDQLFKGNAGPLMALTSTGSQMAETMSIGATLSILCGDEIDRSDPEKMKAAGQDSFTRDTYFRYWASACANWPYAPVDTQTGKQFTSDIPALLLSGAVDPVTPPTNGELWMRSLTNARHIVAPETGHNTAWVGCIPDMVDHFVKTLDYTQLKTSCLDGIHRPAFVTGFMGPERRKASVGGSR